jgi:acetyl-CoA carboxylase carboxyl transferase subunit alpha
MNPNYLDFEQPIAELEGKIEELGNVGSDADLNLAEEIERLREKSKGLTEKIYADLSPWDIVRVARHPSTSLHIGLYRTCFYGVR